MKRKFLFRFFTFAVIAAFVAVTSCKDYDDDISNLEEKITGLTTDVAALKTSVASLETSTSGMTYIKSITLASDGKLTITPSSGSAIVYDAADYVTYDVKLEGNKLYVNDAEKGVVTIPALSFADGVLKSGTETVADLTGWFKSGLTVVEGKLAVNGQQTTVDIPVAAGKTVKGVELDGTSIKVTYTDDTSESFDNAPIVATTVDGNLVLNGVDTGVKVKNTYSVVDGELAVNGEKTGVAIPTDVKYVIVNKDSEDNILGVTVSDGKDSFTIKQNPTNELLAGLLFAPNVIEDGMGVIDLGYINGVLGLNTVKSTFQTDLKLNFRFNPSSADVSNTEWIYIANSAKFRAAPSTDNAAVFTVSSFTDKNGWGEFGLQVSNWAEPAAGENRLLALQATGKDFYNEGETKVVTSDYVKVVPVQYNATISDAKKTPYVDYRISAPAITDANDHEDLLYTASDVDLLDYVWATATPAGGGTKKTFEDYGFTDYKFEFSTEVNYAGLDGITNQNAFVELDGSKLSVLQGTAAIDRQPLIQVTLKSSLNDAILAVGYIKFKIVRSAPVPVTPKTYTFDGGTIAYNTLFKGQPVIGDNKTDITITWQRMNQIYTELGLSHNQFRTVYNVTPTAVPVDEGHGGLVRSTENPDVDSYALKYQITPLAKFGQTTVTYTFTPSNPAAYPVVNFVFTYNIVKPTLDKTILSGYRYNGSMTDVMTKGMNTGSGYLMQLYLGEAFAFGTPAYRNVFAAATNGKIDGATHNFQFKPTPPQSGAALNPLTGGTIDAALGSTTATTSGQLLSLTTKLTTPERVYDMQFVTGYPNGESDVFDFKVHFVNPFEIVLASPVDFQLIDKVNGQADTQDIKTNYIVTFNGKRIVTQGVAETADGANTVKATDYVDITDPSYGLFYELTPGTEYFTISKENGNAFNKYSVLTWQNAGTRLITEQTVAKAEVKFVASFAEITRTADNITVKPE